MDYTTTPATKQTIDALWRLEKIILDTLDFNDVVQKIVDSVLLELGYLQLGHRIVVLALLDEKTQTLKRISISQTDEAKKALEVTPVPFKELDVPLSAVSNICAKTVLENRPYTTHDWAELLCPPYSKDQAIAVQMVVGIKTSMVFPVVSKGKAIGVLIFSMIKGEKEVSENEMDLIRGFTDVVGLAVQNSRLYSSLEKTTTDLKQANIRLQELDKLKDEFVSLASHELRTPMTVIQGYAWMALNDKEDKLSDNNKVRLEKVLSSTQRLIALVNDILDVSRIESGMMVFKPAEFDIALLSDDVAGELADKSKKNNVILKVNKNASYNVLADKDKIHEVLLNLMDNAIKYSPNGGEVNVDFKVLENSVEISVSDTGIGITKENLGKLFTKFGRLESTLSSGYKTPGTGLGLYLCKKIVEKSGGQIWAESESGKGSKFSFSVPKVRA